MKFSYDPQCNIAYLRPRCKSSGVESVKISDEFLTTGQNWRQRGIIIKV